MILNKLMVNKIRIKYKINNYKYKLKKYFKKMILYNNISHKIKIYIINFMIKTIIISYCMLDLSKNLMFIHVFFNSFKINIFSIYDLLINNK